MIKGVHHVQITIPKGAEEEGRNFYCGLLGLEEIEKPHSLKNRGGFWLQVGYREVHVGTEDHVDRKQTKAHIAYEVANIKQWKQRLQTAGIEPIDSIPIPGYERFEFQDPFGNRVEMIERI